MDTISWTEQRDQIGRRMKHCGLGAIIAGIMIYILVTPMLGFPFRVGLAISFAWLLPGAVLSLLYFMHSEDKRTEASHFLFGLLAPLAFVYLIIWPVSKYLWALLMDIKEEIQAFFRIIFVRN